MCALTCYLQYFQHMRHKETSCHLSDGARTCAAEVCVTVHERKRPRSVAMGNMHQYPIGAQGFNIGLTPNSTTESLQIWPVSAAKSDNHSLLLTERNHSHAFLAVRFQCSRCMLPIATDPGRPRRKSAHSH